MSQLLELHRYCSFGLFYLFANTRANLISSMEFGNKPRYLLLGILETSWYVFNQMLRVKVLSQTLIRLSCPQTLMPLSQHD